jgi:3D-(3,5/4)-trihydroxycyclohexane-1,2-dione acylhydrolase (decyclizing)
MKTVRLTMAQALMRHLAALRVEEDDGSLHPYCGGVFAIFGHGNVAGLGEAMHAERESLPTFRAHNEQGMALAAVAYAKAHFRRRILAASSSIGPGATNMVTAAAVAHVDRIPVLLLPGDTFASRQPDPVLQQIEDFQQGDVTASDCFRPVSRYFDRITRPEQILTALPRAIQVMTDPAMCGPVTLSLPQDVQGMAFDCPESFLLPDPIRFRRPPPDADELARAVKLLAASRKPLIVAGGGVSYSQASAELRAFAEAHGVPVAESHGGKSCVPWDMPLNLGGIGVDGGAAANDLARDADVVFAVGTRLQDFTTGSHALFAEARLLSLNVQRFDAGKWSGGMLVADAKLGLAQLTIGLSGWNADAAWTIRARDTAARWNARVTELTTHVPKDVLPYDAEVIGAVRDSHADSPANDIVVCAAGTLPAELHKLWRASRPGGYHVEYGYSCMGYEIAGGLGVKMARPDAEVIVIVGDGSYMMLNAELATSVLLGRKLIVVVLDNRGYGCIERLQVNTGNAGFNNLLDDCIPEGGARSTLDFAMNARSMGATAVKVANVAELKAAMVAARAAKTTQVIVIDTTHERITAEGGCWWQVGLPEVSQRPEVREARGRWLDAQTRQRL